MSTSLKLTWKESVANEKSKYVEIKWKANDKKISRARKKNEQILTYQQFSRPNQKYHADGQKATIRIDKPELNLFDFVDSLNNILRDCILVDSQTGKRFRITFEFRESYTALLHGTYIKPKVECKLEEIDGEFI